MRAETFDLAFGSLDHGVEVGDEFLVYRVVGCAERVAGGCAGSVENPEHGQRSTTNSSESKRMASTSLPRPCRSVLSACSALHRLRDARRRFHGRAQLIVGRGSLTDSFPLFGFDLADYEDLFEEKLDLLVRLLRRQPVTWSGKFRSPLANQFVSPPIPNGHLPTWVGVGGSPQSVVRAARFGLPLMLAIIGGQPERFAPYMELYERALEQAGQPELPIGLHTLGFVAETDDEALEIQWPYYKEQFEWAAQERGWPSPTYEHFLAEVDHGSMFVGSPETVAARIAAVIRTLSLRGFDLHYAIGRIPHEQRCSTFAAVVLSMRRRMRLAPLRRPSPRRRTRRTLERRARPLAVRARERR